VLRDFEEIPIECAKERSARGMRRGRSTACSAGDCCLSIFLCNYSLSASALVSSSAWTCPRGSKHAIASLAPMKGRCESGSILGRLCMVDVLCCITSDPTIHLPEAPAQRRVSPRRGQDPRRRPPRHDVGPVHVGARRERVARDRRVRHVAR
jgi:hypothetical protein